MVLGAHELVRIALKGHSPHGELIEWVLTSQGSQPSDFVVSLNHTANGFDEVVPLFSQRSFP